MGNPPEWTDGITRAFGQPPAERKPVTIADVNHAAEEMFRVGIGAGVEKQLREHLLVNAWDAADLARDASLERRSHLEERPVRVPWWTRIRFAILRHLASTMSGLTHPGDRWLLEGVDDIRALDFTVEQVWDETEVEHIERLKQAARANRTPWPAIPVHTSPYVPRGTVYAFDPEKIMLVKPTSVADVTVDPADDDEEPDAAP